VREWNLQGLIDLQISPLFGLSLLANGFRIAPWSRNTGSNQLILFGIDDILE
jgi:hypothetical protein